MKILFSGYHNPRFMALTEYTERALRSLGHELSIFDHRKFVFRGRVHMLLPPVRRLEMRWLNQRFIRQAEEFRPDMVLVNQGANLWPETIDEVRQRLGAPVVNWFQDYPIQYEDSVRIAPHYDHFFWGDSYPMDKHQALGYTHEHWLPFACDPEIHRPVELTRAERERYACEVCFVGSNYPGRVELFEQLTDFDLGLWGPGWERLPTDSPLRRHVRGGIVPPDEWVKIYNASAVVLNFDGHGQTLDELGHMANTRVYEASACGALQLVQLKKDIQQLFESGREMVFYDRDHPGELHSLIRHYLDHTEERAAIAERGMQTMREKHTYRHRMEALISTVFGGDGAS